MRHVIFGMTCFLIVYFVCMFMLTVHGKGSRESELNEALMHSMRPVMQEMGDGKYTSEAEVKEEILNKMRTWVQTESQVEIDVKGCNLEKGILRVQAKETFHYPNQNIGTILAEETAIVDRKYQVLEDEEMGKNSHKRTQYNPSIYIEYLRFDGEKRQYILDESLASRRVVRYGKNGECEVKIPSGTYIREMFRETTKIEPVTKVYESNLTESVIYTVILFPTQTEQRYQYYIENPYTHKQTLVKTVKDKCKTNTLYTTKIERNLIEGSTISRLEFKGRSRTYTQDFDFWADDFYDINVFYVPNRTVVSFHGNGGEGTMKSIEVYYGFQKELPNISFSRVGYDFLGWTENLQDETCKLWGNKESFIAPLGPNNGKIDLYAVWKPKCQQVKIVYHGNGATEGRDTEIDGNLLDDVIILLDNSNEMCQKYNTPILVRRVKYEISKEETGGRAYQQETVSTLCGWSLEPSQKEGRFSLGKMISVEELYARGMPVQGLEEIEERKAVIHLYAIWDDAPKLVVPDAYFREEDLVDGILPEEYLLEIVKAIDPEEGILGARKEEDNNTSVFFLENMDKSLHVGGDIYQVVVTAVDGAGNMSSYNMKVTIVSVEKAIKKDKENIRFISWNYLETLGIESVWRVEADYRKELMRIISSYFTIIQFHPVR